MAPFPSSSSQVIEHPCKTDVFPNGCGPITSIRQAYIQQPSATVVIWSMRVTAVAGIQMSIEDIVQRLHAPPAPWLVDPRYHSALCIGAISAPDLGIAYGYPSADVLDEQLNASMHRWMSNPDKGSTFNMYVSFSSVFAYYIPFQVHLVLRTLHLRTHQTDKNETQLFLFVRPFLASLPHFTPSITDRI